MKLLETITRAAVDPLFYQEIRSDSVFDVLSPLFKVAAIGATLSLGVVYVGLISLTTIDIPGKALALYPDALEITLGSGEVHTNQPQPYYIPNTLSDKGPKNLVVFDENDELPTDLEKNSTYILVKKNFAVYEGGQNKQQFVSFASATTSTTTITKALVTGYVDKVRPYIKPGIVFGGALLLILCIAAITIFWTLFHIFYCLVPAVLLFAVLKMTKETYTFNEAYMLAAYASIPVAIAMFAAGFVGLAVPYLTTLLIVALALYHTVLNKSQSIDETPQ